MVPFGEGVTGLHNPFGASTPANETGENEKKKKKKCSQDTHKPYRTLLNATHNAARPPRGKCASIVKRSHEPPALSALTITALITPSSKGDTKGRKRAQKMDKDKYKESGIAASRLIMSVIGWAQLF